MHARTIDRPRGRTLAATLGAASLIVLAGLGWPASVGPVKAADTTALFDSSIVHAIAVRYEPADYEAMIAAYKDSGDKEWIDATVTIDGTTYEDAGIRLKGNSSLMSLRGGFGGRGLPAATPAPDASPAADASGQPDVTVGRPGGFGGPGGVNQASADAPERLPWLIRLDRNVEGQNHGGITDLVVRSNNSQTSLNEAVALELLEAAGLASQQAAPTAFSVNGGDRVLRLIIENPDDRWQAASFEGDGALYKAESTGDWTYRGEDQEAYADVFDQEAGKDVADLTPLIDLLAWLDGADDATFAAELASRLDVDAFATYLAMMDLVDNFDDIDGPGNNAYLHWDAATGLFTIVPWDMNLAFGGMGGGRGFGGLGGNRIPDGVDPTASFDPSRMPEGFPTREGGPGGFGRSNPLTQRFHANAEFEALYQAKLVSLRGELYDSGMAQGIVDAWAGVLTAGATDLVDAATIAQEAAGVAEAFATS